MGLLSFLQRSSDTPSEPAPAPDAVAAARIRARRRLIGATVLLAIGIVGFPLLFETQPRPVPVDVPIELARKDGAAGTLAAPLASAPGAVLTDSSSAAPAAASRPLAVKSAEGEVTERAEEQGRERPPPTAATSPTTAVADAAVAAGAGAAAAAAAAVPKAPTQAAAPAPSASKAAEAHAAASKPVAPRPAASTAATGEAARARALLNDRAAASAPAGRMVVQVGAFTEADKLREARSKVEKLGFKTYTQVVSTEGGKRTRVRVGPFATRAEADKAASRLKAAGLPAAILTL